MASNDYYNTHGNSHQYGGHEDSSYHGSRPQDAPLPSLPSEAFSHDAPSSTTAHSAVSPFSTPFDDHHTYTPYNQSTQSIDHPYSYTDSAQQDPFRDSNAIPLQTKHGASAYDHVAPSPTAAMANAEQFGNGGYPPKDEEVSRGPKSWFKGKIPFAVYTISLVQIIVFIVEIIKNATLTGSPIEIHPSVNPMLGPSPYVQINMGGRYVPCMREYPAPNNQTIAQYPVPCPNSTTTDSLCSLAELCGFGLNLTGQNGAQLQPNQWFRFIVPIFLHGGILHIGFNLLLQLTLGKDMERTIGTLRFVLVYFAAGIFGFVFGGNFSPNGIVSTGCSGALFGIIAITLLDLCYTWKTRKNPGRELAFLMAQIVITFVIGLLPAIDNFSHIGGFLTGIVLGICLLHSPDSLRERIGLDEPPYASMTGAADPGTGTGMHKFVRAPVGFFKGRKPLWWAWWLVRAAMLAAMFAAFIVLLNDFYLYRSNCTWCKYLSCLPIKDWCEVGNIQFTTTPAKRAAEVFGL
ncbi:rhomboid-domain-containing protein [Microthyrium microscopicum]|uniref:Rhomboid-type serine protease n=1 Tax=Microthyrium microscopicum TaxID=703497 RepID=A0A6A6UFI1_9PEZI|nr:rhomboid-domain-containing protein [Microthyrium microscopicum]